MSKLIAVLTFVLVTLPLQLHACRGSVSVPVTTPIEEFDAILAVEVTGVHLTAYEAYLARLRTSEAGLSANGEELAPVLVTSSTPEFEVRVVVDRAVLGQSETLRSFTLWGCAVPVPTLRMKGFMFLRGSQRTVAIWESHGELYRAWANRLSPHSQNER